jgi:hypothetical protein
MSIHINTDEVEKIVLESVTKHIGDKLNYNNVLGNMVNNAIESQRESIQNTLDSMMQLVVSDKEFKSMIKQEFQHKVAKIIVGKLEGAVEKSVDIYRSNPTLRSKMIIAIENIINENSDLSDGKKG